MAKQLTVFVENRAGRVQSVSQILAENSANVWAFTIQDRGEFGLMKVIVDKPKDAMLALEDRGFACALKDVLAIKARDEVGNLNKLTSALVAEGVDIADAYGFVAPEDRWGLCFLEIKDHVDANKVGGVLEKEGFEILSDEELYEL
jgi:hypothetical protein